MGSVGIRGMGRSLERSALRTIGAWLEKTLVISANRRKKRQRFEKRCTESDASLSHLDEARYQGTQRLPRLQT